MDKYEYKVRSEEIVRLIDEEKYAEAADVADTVDWRRVKSVSMLLKIAALYSINRRNEDSRAILKLAYDRYPTNRSVVYSLCEISIELDDVVAAIEYYKQFAKIAPKDTGVITLRYRILEAQEASLEERIALLEELKKRDYQEEWAYELAYLYHRVGLETKCIEECDDIILWFGDGSYVMKAMELKMLHRPLTDVQQAKYNLMLENAENGYVQNDYSEEAYSENGEYADGEYPAGEYADDGYGENGKYADGEYTDGEYPDEGYAQGGYDSNGYDGNGYDGNGYDGNGYVDNAYSDEYYQDDFYTEQTYDENGNPIAAADEYNEGEYPQDMPSAPSQETADMSAYNTINLQKVVAEGMKEILASEDDFMEDDEFNNAAADDNATVELAAVAEKQSEAENQSETEDQVKATAENQTAVESQPEVKTDEKAVESEEEAPALHMTGKVAMLTDGVSEAAPEPNTGAISKVIVPGENARFIKADADIEELRDTTEQSVNEEHSRMEANSENIYQNEAAMSNTDEAVEPAFKPITGQISLEDVLSQWEDIKRDNAKKHEDEIKQQVLTQTGKILASFDDALKDGLMDELEAEKDNFQGSDSLQENDDFSGNDSFLDADVTSDIPEVAKAEQEAGDAAIPPVTDEEAAAADKLGATRTIPLEEVNRQINDTVAESEQEQEPKTLDEEDEQSIAETALEDALRTQEIKMNTADLSSLSDRIVETTEREATGAKRVGMREFTADERKLFENFAVTKKIKRQILSALENMTLSPFTGNVIITGDTGVDTIQMAKNLIRAYQAADESFSGKVAKITGEKINQRNLKEVFDKLNNGGIIIEKANGMTEETLYELATLLNQDSYGIIVILEDTKKEITKLLEKQAMITDYFTIRIDLMEMDNNALVAYAKNYALALEYSIDELGVLALYTRISNIQSGNHAVTKDEVREIIDEAIWKSKRSRVKNFVDVLFARRYDNEDMIVLKERDFM